MDRFSFSGLWQHVGTTVVAALLPIVDGSLVYLGKVSMPNWAHALVAIAALAFGFYRGKPPVVTS